MTKQHARKANMAVPAALDDGELERVVGGVDPTTVKVVFVGGSRRYVTGTTGSGTDTLVGIDFRPS